VDVVVMRERDIEKKLVREIRRMGGEAYKWTSPGNDGVPDRIVMLPGGRLIFVELKADRGQLEPIQRVQIRRIQKLGQEVRVVRGMDGLEEFLREEVMPHEVHTS
jgi:Holliday junction resolvase